MKNLIYGLVVLISVFSCPVMAKTYFYEGGLSASCKQAGKTEITKAQFDAEKAQRKEASQIKQDKKSNDRKALIKKLSEATGISENELKIL